MAIHSFDRDGSFDSTASSLPEILKRDVETIEFATPQMRFPVRFGSEQVANEEDEQRDRWNALFDPDYPRRSVPAMVTFSKEEEHQLSLPLTTHSVARPPQSHLHARKPTVTSVQSTDSTRSVTTVRRTSAPRECLANSEHVDDFMRERYRILGVLRKGNAPLEREAIRQLLGPATGPIDHPSSLKPGFARERWDRLKEEARKQTRDNGDGTSLKQPQQSTDIEKSVEMTQQELGETPEEVKGYRLSFVYFLVGFLCPPFWVIGALYDPPYSQSIQSRNKDLKWRSRARWALFFSMFFIIIGSLMSIIIYRELAGSRGLGVDDTKPTVRIPSN
ncbi:hypothetical protein DFQ30_000303 [Apophysomyces sp. BC1015]|nr:hypothetical protein DFQ30_000303 [Apophysomyces sp. BC1015]KAG0180988.1 hypothetical protein DFQ29_009596 [Apophysomyces sp. BC1021]